MELSGDHRVAESRREAPPSGAGSGEGCHPLPRDGGPGCHPWENFDDAISCNLVHLGKKLPVLKTLP